jgi:hypothetical protein
MGLINKIEGKTKMRPFNLWGLYPIMFTTNRFEEIKHGRRAKSRKLMEMS